MRIPNTWLTRRIHWLGSRQWQLRQESCRRAKRIVEGGLFDPAFYLWKYPDVRLSGIGAEGHFTDFGAFEGRNPNGVLDEKWYANQAGIPHCNPVAACLHYMETGSAANVAPNPIFDPDYYLSQAGPVSNALGNYLQSGCTRGLWPHPLFDPAHVKQQASADVRHGMEPLSFFVTLRSVWYPNPHPLFDSAYYLRQSREALRERMNPLTHFLTRGAGEGIRPHPLFDPQTMAACQAYGGSANPLRTYVSQPAARMCRPHALFDPDLYLAACPEAGRSNLPLLEHYLRTPPEAQPSPMSGFDPKQFRTDYPQVEEQGCDPLAYFAEYGAAFGLSPTAPGA